MPIQAHQKFTICGNIMPMVASPQSIAHFGCFKGIIASDLFCSCISAPPLTG
jgi:hypothetical protein